MTLPHGALCWSSVCDCGISWSYSLIFVWVKGVLYNTTSKTVKKNLTPQRRTCPQKHLHSLLPSLASCRSAVWETSTHSLYQIHKDKRHEHARIKKVLSEGFQLRQRLFSLRRQERIQIPIFAGHYRHASKTPFINGVSLACQWSPNIECWLGSLVNLRGSGPVLLRKPIFLWFFMGGGGGADPLSTLWIREWWERCCSVIFSHLLKYCLPIFKNNANHKNCKNYSPVYIDQHLRGSGWGGGGLVFTIQ